MSSISGSISGGISKAPWSMRYLAKLALNLLTLNDRFGNVHEPNVRNSTATFFPYDSPMVTVPINEARRDGMRRVENLLSFPEDFSNPYWSIFTSGGGTSTVSQDKKSITFTVPNGGRAFINMTIALPTDARLSVSRIINSGTTTRNTLLLGAVHLVSNLSGRMSISTNTGGTSFRFGIGCNGLETSAVSITYTLPQLENVTGKANQNPSEFVNGVAYKNTTNANTVLNNIVTEATGELLHPHKASEGVLTPWSYPSRG